MAYVRNKLSSVPSSACVESSFGCTLESLHGVYGWVLTVGMLQMSQSV